MDDYAFLDNVFCTAILRILEIPDILTDSPSIDLDEVKCDFEKNGTCDETYYDHDTTRAPLTDIQSRINKKKAQKLANAQNNFCQFCENNQEPPKVYNSHSLRDSKGKLMCPRLRKYVCPICNATGDNAHTVRYCTKKPIFVIKGGNDAGVLKKIRPKAIFKKTIRL
ncbi:nanos homolog 1 [Bradysia coprophila]|uniref:nanos homolog 1 n=1 Tax=Bradysia coprophila TaxID=38358 RepID=UPI00187D843C|nr:nanos homolog 1 [Bradysia coprophila]